MQGMVYFLQNNWAQNISQATNGDVSLLISSTDEDPGLRSDYILDRAQPTNLDATNRLIVLNESLKNNSISLDSIQPHVSAYFVNNVKRRISEESKFSVNEKTILIKEAKKINEALVTVTLNKERVNLLEYISSHDFKNINKMVALLMLSEIEAFYIRESYVIPIQNSLEGLERKPISHAEISGNYLKVGNSYSCLESPPILSGKADD